MPLRAFSRLRPDELLDEEELLSIGRRRRRAREDHRGVQAVLCTALVRRHNQLDARGVDHQITFLFHNLISLFIAFCRGGLLRARLADHAGPVESADGRRGLRHAQLFVLERATRLERQKEGRRG